MNKSQLLIKAEIKATEKAIAKLKRESRQLFRLYKNTYDGGDKESAQEILVEHSETTHALEFHKGMLSGLKFIEQNENIRKNQLKEEYKKLSKFTASQSRPSEKYRQAYRRIEEIEKILPELKHSTFWID